MEDLISKTYQIIDLERKWDKLSPSFKNSEFARIYVDFLILKSYIKKHSLPHSLLNFPDTDNKITLEILQKITSNEILEIEKKILKHFYNLLKLQSESKIDLEKSREIMFNSLFTDELSSEEMDDLGSKLFYSWFSDYEYIKGLYDAGSLILNIGKIPELLEPFVDQARNCYAFQQYLAVVALCRTILEIAIRDIYTKIDDFSTKKKTPVLAKMIDEICTNNCSEQLKDELKRIKNNTNELIHGAKSASASEAKETLKNSLKLIQELYDKFQKT